MRKQRPGILERITDVIIRIFRHFVGTVFVCLLACYLVAGLDVKFSSTKANVKIEETGSKFKKLEGVVKIAKLIKPLF